MKTYFKTYASLKRNKNVGIFFIEKRKNNHPKDITFFTGYMDKEICRYQVINEASYNALREFVLEDRAWRDAEVKWMCKGWKRPLTGR